jgi:hypothetical protein
MSTYEYRPNGAGTRPIYDIGSIGWELPKPKGLWDFCLNTVKGTYPVEPSLFDLAHNKKDKPSSPKDSTELGIEPAKGRIKISTLSCRT